MTVAGGEKLLHSGEEERAERERCLILKRRCLLPMRYINMSALTGDKQMNNEGKLRLLLVSYKCALFFFF